MCALVADCVGSSIAVASCVRVTIVPRLLTVLLSLALTGVCIDATAQDHAMMAPADADPRKPLPLTEMMAEHQKQNMRDHLAAVQAIVSALTRDDMAAVATATDRIGFSEAMGQMCEHMGAAAPGFNDLAVGFHRTADTIGLAAKAGDRAEVLAALDRTLQACVACHASYKQEIVDQATWTRLATAAAN
jgi:cytochrome c556